MTSPADTPRPGDLEAALREVFAAATAIGAPNAEQLIAVFSGPPSIDTAEAEVIFVSDGDPSLVGVRAAGLLEGRQIVAESGDLTVVLDIAAAGADDDGRRLVRVRGEVIGTDDVLSLQLLDGLQEIGLTVTDELGEFGFDSIPAGEYDLVMAGPRREVSLRIQLD